VLGDRAVSAYGDDCSNQEQDSHPTNPFEASDQRGFAGHGLQPERDHQWSDRQSQNDKLNRIAGKPNARKAKAQSAKKDAPVAQGQHQTQKQQRRQQARAPIAHASHRDCHRENRSDPCII
jgi:hypothetical protein